MTWENISLVSTNSVAAGFYYTPVLDCPTAALPVAVVLKIAATTFGE